MNEFDANIVDLKPVDQKKSGSFGKTVAVVLSCSILGGLSGVGGAALYNEFMAPKNTAQIFYTNPPLEATKVVNYSSADVALPELYTMNMDSTVGIQVSTTVNFYGQPTTSAATGSGFVISENGYIVTNYHVIEEAVGNDSNPIEVKFLSGDSYMAEIVGFEEDNDLAVLKIEASGLKPVVMGDSDSLVVGETVVAIGNPLGELDFSFTNGIISAKDRLISLGSDLTMNMLQTNTAINPGNSGGPLFDGQGALIGINTAKYAAASDGTTVEGLGFAIPINDVKEMIPDIIANGYVTGKPYLGIVVSDVSGDAQKYGVVAGASVNSVAEGGAAEKAGLKANDIITAIDDVAINSSSALTAALTNYKAGDTAVFTAVRGQETLTFDVTFDEKNEETEKNNQIIEETNNNSNNNNNNNNNGGNNYSYGWDNFPGFNFPFW